MSTREETSTLAGEPMPPLSLSLLSPLRRRRLEAPSSLQARGRRPRPFLLLADPWAERSGGEEGKKREKKKWCDLFFSSLSLKALASCFSPPLPSSSSSSPSSSSDPWTSPFEKPLADLDAEDASGKFRGEGARAGGQDDRGGDGGEEEGGGSSGSSGSGSARAQLPLPLLQAALQGLIAHPDFFGLDGDFSDPVCIFEFAGLEALLRGRVSLRGRGDQVLAVHPLGVEDLEPC